MATSGADLHIFFLALPAAGHIIPMLDLSILISTRGVRCSIITTPANAKLLLPSLSDPNNQNTKILTIPFSSDHLPENLAGLTIPDVTPDFFASLCGFEPHVEELLLTHRPDCIISDTLYPWTAGLAKRHGIPRISFTGTSHVAHTIMSLISILRLHDSVASPDEPFLIPGLPHPIKMTRLQLPPVVTSPPQYMDGIIASFKDTYGMIMNTFYELESAYSDCYKSFNGDTRIWNVGPVFLYRRSEDSIQNRGGVAASDVFDWLDRQKAESVLYVCFGSISHFTAGQVREIRLGLEAAGQPFVWVVRDEAAVEDSVSNGFIIKGWAPQLRILRHQAVGGFLTHCGWNSCMEGIAAGVPMVTWPLFMDQQFNERLLVDVLGVGVAVGSMVNSMIAEERPVVVAERVAAAVETIMGGGFEAEDRKRKAREMKAAAAKAVSQGGSSELDLGRMLEELLALKTSRMNEAAAVNVGISA